MVRSTLMIWMPQIYQYKIDRLVYIAVKGSTVQGGSRLQTIKYLLRARTYCIAILVGLCSFNCACDALFHLLLRACICVGWVGLNKLHQVDMHVHWMQVGMVFQSYALFNHMTVADNIKFGLQVCCMWHSIRLTLTVVSSACDSAVTLLTSQVCSLLLHALHCMLIHLSRMLS